MKIEFNFEKLEVYQKALDLIDKVHSLTRNYPKEETFGLTGQFKRASLSIALNIAEGSARTKRDFRRFLDIAKGSVLECLTVLEISRRHGYVNQDRYSELRLLLTDIAKMLSGLKRSLTMSLADYKQAKNINV
jgi:four helix bundle protein